MIVQAQAIKLPKKKEETDLKPVPLANDRPLEPNEEEAEEKAIKLPRKQFKRIAPIPGTLGYLFRDLVGGNKSVFEFVNNSLDHRAKQNSTTIPYKIYKVILLWNSLDEFSQNRVDVFDWLCDRVGVAKDRFYGQAMQGMFSHYESISQRILMESKTELIHNVRQFAGKERNFRDRELLAKATKVVSDVPLIGSIDNSTKVTNLTFESGFKDTLRSTEKLIREDDFIDVEEIEPERMALPEANLNEVVSIEDFLVKEERETEKVER